MSDCGSVVYGIQSFRLMGIVGQVATAVGLAPAGLPREALPVGRMPFAWDCKLGEYDIDPDIILARLASVVVHL